MPGTDSITVYVGEDVVLPFAMVPPTNVAGWTMAFTVRGASGVVISKTSSSGIAVTSEANGTWEVTLTDADTDTLRPGTYLYDLWRTDANNERIVARGDFIASDVARAVS